MKRLLLFLLGMSAAAAAADSPTYLLQRGKAEVYGQINWGQLRDTTKWYLGLGTGFAVGITPHLAYVMDNVYIRDNLGAVKNYLDHWSLGGLRYEGRASGGRLGLFGQFGLGGITYTTTVHGSRAGQVSEFGYHIGGGANVAAGKNWGVRIDYRWVSTKTVENAISFVGVGFYWRAAGD